MTVGPAGFLRFIFRIDADLPLSLRPLKSSMGIPQAYGIPSGIGVGPEPRPKSVSLREPSRGADKSPQPIANSVIGPSRSPEALKPVHLRAGIEPLGIPRQKIIQDQRHQLATSTTHDVTANARPVKPLQPVDDTADKRPGSPTLGIRIKT